MDTISELREKFRRMDARSFQSQVLMTDASNLENLFCRWGKGDYSRELDSLIRTAFDDFTNEYNMEVYVNEPYSFTKEQGMDFQQLVPNIDTKGG